MTTAATFAAEVVALYPRLYRFALVLTRNREAAEDLTQETVLRALANQERFDGRNLVGWLTTIMRNYHSDAQSRGRFWVDFAVLPVTVAPPAQEHAAACQEAMRVASAETNGAQELLMQAMGYYDYEIAAARGIPVGTVASRAFRSRQHLLNLERQT